MASDAISTQRFPSRLQASRLEGKLVGVVAALVLAASAAGAQTPAPARAVLLSDSTAVTTVLHEVWAAAEAEDTATLRRLTIGRQASNWFAARARAVPRFFASTQGSLVVSGMDHPKGDTTRISLRLQTPHVSCPKPAHSGAPDLYVLYLRRGADGWQVEEIGMPIC